MSKIVAWNPNDREQFVSSGRKIELTEFQSNYEGENTLRIVQEVETTDITCLEWHPFEDTSLMAFGTNQGEVGLVNWDKNLETVICKPSHIGRRSCNGVSWNKLSHSRFAASFDNLKSEGCVTVWDFEQEKFQRLSHGEAVSTLTWLPDNQHLLVLGTAMGWIRVCDMRSGSQQPAISFLGHPAPRPRKIKGIRVDPFQHGTIATFSDGFGDPIRLWDLRRNGPGKTQLIEKFSVQVTGIGQRDTTIHDVVWSPSRPNVLAVAPTGQKNIFFYSTAHTAGTNVSSSPIRVLTTSEPVKSFSWRGLDARHKETYSINGTVFEVDTDPAERNKSSPPVWEAFKTDESVSAFPYSILERRSRVVEDKHPPHAEVYSSVYNRLLLGTAMGVVDVEVRDSVGLTVSSSGMIAESLGITINLNSNDCAPYPFSISEDSVAGCLNNTAMIMKYRGSVGYSVEESKNIEVLSGEMDHLYVGIHQLTVQLQANSDSKDEIEASLSKLTLIANATMEVFRMWVWADRFEAMSNQTNLSLTNCGIINVIQNETKQTDQQNYRSGSHPNLGAEVYLSKSRSLCKQICGWIDILGMETLNNSSNGSSNNNNNDTEGDDDAGLLEVIVTECLDGFERGCAMALWHGDLNLAVAILRKAMARFEKNTSDALLSPSCHSPSPGSDTESQSEFMSPVPKNYNSADEIDENNIDWDEEISVEYMRIVSLVCMCLAGYNYSAYNRPASTLKTTSGKNVSGNVSGSSAWASMCKHVITELRTQTRRGSSYLTACCVFLLSTINEYSTEDEYHTLEENVSLHGSKSSANAIKVGYRVILADERMTLDDRIAFASTFLSNGQVVDWLTRMKESAKSSGRLDYLMVTGLSADGLDILQQYVDRYDDLQTVALLVSRIVDNNTVDGISRPAREWIWLHEYRNLLNKWGLFIYRAKLDVELGRRYRNRSEATTNSSKTPKKGEHTSPKGRGGPVGVGANASFKGKPQGFGFSSKGGGHQPHQDRSKRVLYKISPHSDFPHIYLRCSYCGTSLPIDGMQTTKAESLRSQKSVLNCCAGCSKQLPRCYVCQLYMGMVNPYRELNRTMTQKRLHADNLLQAHTHGGVVDKQRKSFSNTLPVSAIPTEEQVKSDHNVIDFGRWFFFCQHCRHGGHANCIDEWFGGSGGIASSSASSSTVAAGETLQDTLNGASAKSSKRIVCGVNGCNCNCKARK